MDVNLRDPTLYATVLSVAGAMLVAGSTKDIRALGFTIWIISNTMWTYYFFDTKQRTQ